MKVARIVALGNPAAGDDGAALEAVGRLEGASEVVRAGRPGPGLLELLGDGAPTVLADVTRGLGEPGQVTSGALDDLVERLDARAQVSSHGFGPAETLRLARALGRALPPIVFVGIEGQCFDPGAALSPAVERALPSFTRAIQHAVEELSRRGPAQARGGGDA